MERGDIIRWGQYYGVILSPHEALDNHYRTEVITNHVAMQRDRTKKPKFLGINLQESEMELVEEA